MFCVQPGWISRWHLCSARADVARGTCLVIACLITVMCGCGTTKGRTATEQLVLSNSVDRAVSVIDFSPISGLDCWLDTSNIKPGSEQTSFVNDGYIISSLRNQLAAAGCNLVDDRKNAEVIVEARVGTLGSNAHRITYGFPSNNLLSQAAVFVPSAPPVPPLPNISIAEKENQTGATKIAVFAYDAKSGAAVWQSGIATARSNGRDTWILGVGPFQSGDIYEKRRFAALRLSMPLLGSRDPDVDGQQVSLDQPFDFGRTRIADVDSDRSRITDKPEPTTQTADKPSDDTVKQ
jgi:hypothetical protein